MNLEVRGVRYSNFTKATTTQVLDALSSSFQFSATSDSAKPLPFRGNEPCKVFVDNELVLTGYIETVDVDGGDSDHSIEIAGRDKTCDLVDSKIGFLSDIRAPISLKSVINRVIEHLRSPLIVVDDVNPTWFHKVDDLAAAESGQDAFDFIESLARKRQVLLTSNEHGNIIITRASGVVVDSVIRHKVDDSSNNVLSYSVSYDTTQRFNFYRIEAQQNPLTAMASGVSNENMVHQTALVADDTVRQGRQLVVSAENAGSVADQVKRVIWEMNVRKARGLVYSATVPGFRNSTGALWQVNRIVKVEDDYAGINEYMLINSVKFSIDDDGGRVATLALIDKDAYTLTVANPIPSRVGTGLMELRPASEWGKTPL